MAITHGKSGLANAEGEWGQEGSIPVEAAVEEDGYYGDWAVGYTISDAEVQTASVVLLKGWEIKRLGRGDKCHHNNSIIAQLHKFGDHQGNESCGKGITTVVEEETQGGGVAGLAGLLAVHLVEETVDQVGEGLKEAPPGAYFTLETYTIKTE